MLKNKTVAVVVPAFNEEKQIRLVIDSMPSFVDRIVIVDDCSRDKTCSVVQECIKNKKNILTISPVKRIIATKYNEADRVVQQMDDVEHAFYVPSEVLNKNPETERIILIAQKDNGGVGAAIARGYKWCKDHAIDCTAVMAGDGQMDPAELISICEPVVNEGVDYVKGNRLIHRSASVLIPKVRFFGNSVLSMLTKLASGYWRVSDTQTGYTAISLKALKSIDIHNIYRRYGMPNDMLVKLNMAYCTLREIEIKPVYRVGEKSKMNIGKLIPKVSWLLVKSFFKRLWGKYFFRDFHPLFLLYNFGFILILLDVFPAIKVFIALLRRETVTYQSLIIFMFLAISAFQSIFFAMWMDIQDNERLYK
ncbi:MAG: glycosyltransferase family 2 protein [Spirochaetes bacterium]|nr:glycosyltransferase family 2 protein [Spirochaetota bacterium]